MIIVAIGCAPSSGSTFLADLLDSLRFAVCGPELQLFSVAAHYDEFDRIRRRGFSSSRTPVLYAPRRHVAVRELHHYGWSHAEALRCLARCADFADFCRTFFELYARQRGKSCQIAFEKSPENIGCARRFLEAFPDGFFVHIVRDPGYVVRSLRRRGFPPYLGGATWLVDVANASGLAAHPRFLTIRYEDLVRDPFREVSRLVSALGGQVDPTTLEADYRSNRYRRELGAKLATWSITEYGVAGDANTGEIGSKLRPWLAAFLGARVAPRYADLFGIPPAGFSELLARHGYQESFRAHLAGGEGARLRPDPQSLLRLGRKFAEDLVRGDCRLADAGAYWRPIQGEHR